MEENAMEQLKDRLCGRRVLFPLGKVVITRNAALELSPIDVMDALNRHAQGDWGDVCEEDGISNELALVEDTRLFSAYRDTTGQKFWIITEHDRSITTNLLPEDTRSHRICQGFASGAGNCPRRFPLNSKHE
jgi:hypothetical protein